MTIQRNVFSDKDALARALAAAVADDLNAGLDARGTAALAVSGGSTPKRFFEVLGARDDIDWEHVVVTLVDERWVPETSERSNASLVRQTLLQGPAKAAYFAPLYSGDEQPTMLQIEMSNQVIEKDVPKPFDAVILGMGTDGHTASFFPRGDALENALSAAGPLIAIHAPGAGEPRVTFTLPNLLDTRGLYLHIEGDDKARVLDAALEDGPVQSMPVRAVLGQSDKDISLFWCP